MKALTMAQYEIKVNNRVQMKRKGILTRVLDRMNGRVVYNPFFDSL
jgi:hypothetical protein